MWSADARLRRVLKKLKLLVDDGLTSAHLTEDHRADLAQRIAEADRLLLLGANARGAARLIADAVATLERADPLASLIAAKIDYLDHLASTCDRLMLQGEMPDSAYLHALAEAVFDLEAHNGEGAGGELSFAWDILAQAEAGIGEPIEETHYASARQRYRRRAPAEAPMLALVGGTAV